METAELVQRYLDNWNETEPAARRVAVAAVWADDARYVDPLVSVAGHDQISGVIGAFHEQMPGYVFRLLDDNVDSHHNIARFRWELVPAAGGEAVAIGFDVAVTGDDGRIENVLGFLDMAPSA
jgi:hypothetical protein